MQIASLPLAAHHAELQEIAFELALEDRRSQGDARANLGEHGSRVAIPFRQGCRRRSQAGSGGSKRLGSGGLGAAGAAVVVRQAPAAKPNGKKSADATPPPPPAPTLFEVVLKDAGPNKQEVARIIKTLTGLGLREAITFVDQAPAVVKGQLSAADAESIKVQLVNAGATVEIK